MTSIKNLTLFFLRAIFSFKGRLSRVDYLISFFIYLLFFGLLNQVDFYNTFLNLFFSFIYTFFALIWIFALMTKRLHDVNLNGKWLFLFYWFVVMIFFIVSNPNFQEYEYIGRIFAICMYLLLSLILMIYPGTAWKNNYWKMIPWIFYKKLSTKN